MLVILKLEYKLIKIYVMIVCYYVVFSVLNVDFYWRFFYWLEVFFINDFYKFIDLFFFRSYRV